MTMRPSQTRSLLAAATAALCAAVHAAPQWEPVATVRGERIELDKSRIVRKADGRATAWSRVALERDVIDEHGLRYTAIEALNRYDCDRRSFATLKRVYRRDRQTVREETVADVRELPMRPGSADERLFGEICEEEAPAEASAAKPGVMYADVRTAQAAPPPRPLAVADKPAEPRPAEAKPADKPPVAERPRYIELPRIDKSQLEDPNASPPAKPGDAKAAEAKRAADAKGVAARIERAAGERPTAARHELERLYASSGPRKAPKKKPEPELTLEQRNVQWAYEGEGAPANWDKLRKDYALCGTGKRQSPIDIRESIKVDLEQIGFDYKPTRFRITDNGHTIQVDVGDGSYLRVMERQFELVQFHFHRPAEERIAGRTYDMVAHLVHRDDDGKLAIVAVPLEKGAEHGLVQTLWNNMPLERGHSIEPAAVIDLNTLLPPPERRAYYTYMGSLTTPPCTEDVLWMVFKQPMQVSQQQVSIFARLYANNARPLQPANGRLVKETR
jgi:carbonic anhydrase